MAKTTSQESPETIAVTEQAPSSEATVQTTEVQEQSSEQTTEATVEATSAETVETPTDETPETGAEAGADTEIQCDYCGKVIDSKDAVTDQYEKAFCSTEHKETYAETMRQLNNKY